MKKFIYSLILLLPLTFGLTACDDDNDLPDVDVTVEISGGARIGQNIYVVAGDTLRIDSIGVTNLDPGKTAIISRASYSWDYIFIGTSVLSPYGASFPTSKNILGTHLLQIECPLFAVDKSPALMFMAYKVVIVENKDQIPSGQPETILRDKPGIKEN